MFEKRFIGFFLRLWFPVSAVLLLGGCFNKDDFDLNRLADDGIAYDIALPLTDARLTMENLMSLMGGLLIPDEDGLLYLTYTMDPVSLRLMQQASIPGSVSVSFSSPTIPYYHVDSVLELFFCDSSALRVNGLPAGTEVEHLYMASAKLSLSLENTFDFVMDLEVTFPNIYDAAGQPLSNTYRIGSGQREIVDLYLENIELRREGKTLAVKKEVRATVAMQGGDGDADLHRGTMTVSGSITNMEFKRVEGYLPTIRFSAHNDVSIAGLGVERMKNLTLKEVTMEAEILTEGFSAPVRIDSNAAVLLHSNGQETGFTLFPENYDLETPALDALPLSRTSYVSTVVTDLMVDNPTSISVSLGGSYNPDADTLALQAVEENAGINVGITCRAPLWFSASGYEVGDTMTVSLDQLPDETKINYFELKTIVINAFPLDFELDVIFLDRDKEPLFTLFENRLIAGAPKGTDDAMHVLEPVVSVFDDELITEQVDMVKRSAYVAICGRLSTTDGQEVKIYMPTEMEGFLRVKLGFRTRVTQHGLVGNSGSGDDGGDGGDDDGK